MTLKEVCEIAGKDEKEVREALVKEEWNQYRNMTKHLHGRPECQPQGDIMDYITWTQVELEAERDRRTGEMAGSEFVRFWTLITDVVNKGKKVSRERLIRLLQTDDEDRKAFERVRK